MPIYEYKCHACGNTLEVMQKFSDEPLTECTCQKKGPVERLISSPALQFKGSGWYITDYAKSGSSAQSGDGAKSDTKSGEAKSDAKPSTPSSSSASDSK
jgi:putative FmdB family regulatory protein